MKHVIGLTLGLILGAVIAACFVYINPFSAQQLLSPLSVSDRPQLNLNFSGLADDAILYTNDGESRVKPHPGKVLQLWEAPIRETDTTVTLLRNGRDNTIGFGIKFASKSEKTKLLNGEALVDSVWHVYLPSRGTMLIHQSENHWSYIRDIVIPAHWSSGDSWRGNWHATMTHGPGALGTARVFGGTGEFAGLEFEAIERRMTKAYSAERGPVAMTGLIIVDLPLPEAETAGLNIE